MDSLFSRLTVVDVRRDLTRNIVSLRELQDLFDDLTDDPAEWALAQWVENEVKPHLYRSVTPVIDRPFEDAEWFNAITYPFKQWQASRYSDGAFGVWYGGDSVETTVYETAYHWYRGLLSDAGFEKETVVGERKLYSVSCNAALLDFRRIVGKYPELTHKTDYTYPQAIGARLHREGHPGLVTKSVRYKGGEIYAVFNPGVLSNPRPQCYLTYRVENHQILVEKTPGVVWLNVSVDEF